MGEPEQIRTIQEGVDTWNEWKELHPKETIDLSSVVLFRAYLAGANLIRANLTNADLIETNLIKADLTEAVLAQADLTRAYLAETNLTRTNLIKADLADADLKGANLTGADLTGANLTGADLRGANLTRTYLRDANLTGAILISTNLTKANCTNAIFSVANFAQTVLGDVDLSSARGLDTVKHAGPSIIGIDTIYQSKGKIPEIFLRGAGVPQGFIEYMPSLTEQPIQFYSCFISYSHNDQAFARRLHDGLQGRGIRCWLDEKQLLPGHNIYDEIDRGIRLWDKVLLCCSKYSLKSWWVDDEIARAFAKEQERRRDYGTKVNVLIPLDLDGFVREWKDGKKTQLDQRLRADFKGWEHDNAKFEEQFERVVKALQTDDGREAPPKPLL